MGLPAGDLTCSAVCRVDTAGCVGEALCGNGEHDDGEACDGPELGEQTCGDFGYAYGELACTDGCEVDTSACGNAARCGDGEVTPPEDCDDGNNEDGDGCALDCVWERCGDGMIQADEECEQPLLTVCDNGYVGVQDCVACELAPMDCGEEAVCGNGVVEAGETCDDGDRVDTNGCNNTCQSQTCDDGERQPSEACDGDDVGGLSCQDLGFALGEVTCDACVLVLADCHFPRCGDGVIEGDEACDDGNTASQDGCSRRCEIEPCEGAPGLLAWPDADGDGYGDAEVTGVAVCELLDGMVDRGGDCDDTASAVHPGAEEVCDGVDNDCFDGVDVGATDASAFYLDGDEDGYGAELIGACAQPEGAVTLDGDCDDTDPARYPGASELCDGRDNDCDDVVDGPDPTGTDLVTYYRDADGDAYGDSLDSAAFCPDADHDGYVLQGGDCDDTLSAVNPEATEVCDPDDLDEDCDLLADDADPSVDPASQLTLFADVDGDGYGAGAVAEMRCDATAGLALTDDDCVDSDPLIHPAAEEVCGDLVDSDCDGDNGMCVWEPLSDVVGIGTRIVGDAPEDLFGESIATLDFNGDGWTDIAATARGGLDSRGEVYVFFGPLSGEVMAGDADVLLTHVYAAGFANAELVVESAGNMLGGPGDGLWIGLPDDGRALLAFAADVGPGVDLDVSPETVQAFADADMSLGTAFTSGDLDGDDYVDAVIGASSRSQVFPVYGGAPGSSPTLGAALESLDASDAFGSALANGDAGSGLELAIGAHSAGMDVSGGFYVHRGSDLVQTRAYVGEGRDSLAGRTVTFRGDVDGDLQADWMVSSPTAPVGGVAQAGRVYLVESTLTSDQLADHPTIDGQVGSALFGNCVAPLGDFNSDGFDDLAVGAPSEPYELSAGRIYVFFGQAGGGFAASTADADIAFQSLGHSGLIGWACEGGSDVTGDSVPDLIVSAPRMNVDGMRRGVVYYLPGGIL